MAGTEHERRRFITRHDVEDAAAAGRSLQVRGRDVLTDEAAQRARDLGVAVEREGRGSTARPGGTGPATSPAGAPSGGAPADLRRAVRAAVVAELGSEPPGLDAAIDRVLARRR